MLLLRQVHKTLLTIGLALFLSVITAFSFASGESWATTSFRQSNSQPHTQVAAMDQVQAMTKNVEGKMQEAIDAMTGDPKAQTGEAAKKLEAKTRKGLDNSIENPKYQPDGKTQQMKKQTNEATKGIKAEARKAFN